MKIFRFLMKRMKMMMKRKMNVMELNMNFLMMTMTVKALNKNFRCFRYFRDALGQNRLANSAFEEWIVFGALPALAPIAALELPDK